MCDGGVSTFQRLSGSSQKTLGTQLARSRSSNRVWSRAFGVAIVAIAEQVAVDVMEDVGRSAGWLTPTTIRPEIQENLSNEFEKNDGETEQASKIRWVVGIQGRGVRI
jgi:hypothetical protein